MHDMLMFSLVAVALAAEPTPTSTPLYPPAEAIADALSGPLVPMVGDTGFGPNERLPDCFYRNARVVVINRYCGKREINTTGIQIMHPERGVLYFYAEASAPISSLTREDYEQWRIEVRDPLPGLRVDQSLAEVPRWMHRRTREAQQVCWTGFGSPGGVPTGCHYKTPELKQAWMDAHDALLKSPPPGWYELVRELRGLLGKKPPPVKAPPAADTAGSGPARIVVRVFEYFTHRPVVGARAGVGALPVLALGLERARGDDASADGEAGRNLRGVGVEASGADAHGAAEHHAGPPALDGKLMV